MDDNCEMVYSWFRINCFKNDMVLDVWENMDGVDVLFHLVLTFAFFIPQPKSTQPQMYIVSDLDGEFVNP